MVIDDDPGMIAAITWELHDHYDVIGATDTKEALAMFKLRRPKATLLDVSFPESKGYDLIPSLLKIIPHHPIIMLSAHKDSSTITQALKCGAVDYIAKPFEREDLEKTLARVTQEKRSMINGLEFIGRSAASLRIRSLIQKAAKSDVNVLISGETGTGKEVVAKLIHRHAKGHEGKRPFIAINCAAIPANLMESTLFGHERGAFTGATETKRGKFEEANGGDIFLDEISSLPLELQPKLLRVLQEKEFERVGGNKILKSNFRVISATNHDLYQLAQQGRFREDLIYRLSVIELRIPPLRERPEDIPLLINHYLENAPCNPGRKTISPEARGTLAALAWPGNARQLFHALDNMVFLSEKPELSVDDIPTHVRHQQSPQKTTDQLAKKNLNDFERHLDEVERSWIQRAVDECNYNYSDAAKALGITRSSLYCRMKRLGLQ